MSGTVSLGESQLLAGRLEEAHARTYQERGREPRERTQAEAHYRQALALGTLYATRGREDQARAALSTAINLYRAMEITLWLPEAEAALAQVERR